MLPAVLLFAVAATALLVATRAATGVLSFEPESGILSGVTTGSDTQASGGSYVQFGNISESAWPGQDDFKVCGNASVLNGPTSPPAGAVVVNPGTDLRALTSSRPAGTTFYLTAGTHTLPNGPIDPKTGNQYIGAPGAVLDGQFTTNYTSGSRTMSMAFKGAAHYSNVTIKHLTIKNFGQSDGKTTSMVNQTAINWGQSPGWTVSNNTISHNGGSGIWLVDDSKLLNNCIEYNEQLGFSVPSRGGNYEQRVNVLVEGNEIRYNNRSNAIETLGVCTGCSGGLKVWNAKNVTIRNNNVHSNNGNGIWIDNNNIDILIEANVSKDNRKRGIFYEISYSGIIRDNYITGNYVQDKGGNNNTGIYISESGGDEAVKNYLGGTFPAELLVTNNYVVDNWNHISLWEDAGRYCTSNDTSWCPPLIQGKNDSERNANISKCSSANVVSNAHLCRWRTRNVRVVDNIFEITSAGSSWCSQSATNCARAAIWSGYGMGGRAFTVASIQDNISRNQNNLFNNNTYKGRRNFTIPSSSVVSTSAWQNTWNQDKDSIFQ